MAGSVRGKRMHTGLIAGQIALTLLLLTAAGAAIQGFSRMMQRPLGYDPHHVMSVGIPVHENTLNDWAERAAYFSQLRERVRSHARSEFQPAFPPTPRHRATDGPSLSKSWARLRPNSRRRGQIL